MAGVVGDVGPHQQIHAHTGRGRCVTQQGAGAAVLLHAVYACTQAAALVAATATAASDVEHRPRGCCITAPGFPQVGGRCVGTATAVREPTLEVLVGAGPPHPCDCGPYQFPSSSVMTPLSRIALDSSARYFGSKRSRQASVTQRGCPFSTSKATSAPSAFLKLLQPLRP